MKVLDFGIATLIQSQAEQPTVEDLRTQDKTQTNVVVGTVPYMSPEQARGESLDATCDIWAFGCVAFEMLTARQPFTRGTVVDTVNAILREEPDWSLLPADAPPTITTLLRRCLRKDRYNRLRDIGDARIECADAEDELRRGDLPANNTFETEISDIRRRLLVTTNRHEIERLVFEAEDLLSRAPYNPDLRMIRGALARAVEMGSVLQGGPPQTFGRSEPQLPKSYRTGRPWLVFVAALLLLLLLGYLLR